MIGGDGFDSAFFSGPRSTYTISQSDSVLTITDGRVNLRDGSDQLHSVEVVWFSDGALDFDLKSPNADEAYRIYKAVFDRASDDGGLRYWTSRLDQGATLRDVAQGFTGTSEFVGNYGANPVNQEYVSKLYENVLGRAPDSGGYEWARPHEPG